MTNLEAYLIYNSNEGEATLSLQRYSIIPENSDKTQVSAAIGMIDKALLSDYRQDGTSETTSNEIRAALMKRGKSILAENDVDFLDGNSGGVIVIGSGW